MVLVEGTAPATTVGYSIAEVAGKLDLSPHTLRYYERIGLLEVDRDGGGRRLYSDENLMRLRFITYLRATQLPISELQRYFQLADEGPQTAAERLELLQRHREVVRAQLEGTQAALEAINFKIDFYGEQIAACDGSR